jgi:chromatin modification-related protein EAF6
VQSLDLQGEGDDPGSALEDIKNNGPPTISLPAAKGSEISASQSQKKLRDRDYQRKKRANRRQSTAGVESDEESVVAASVSSRRPNKRGRAQDDD